MPLTSLDLVIIVAVAFVPALIYMVWIRDQEIHLREPFLAVEGVFLYGTTVAIGLAFVLELLAVNALSALTASDGTPLLDDNTVQVILALMLAPVIEEFTKATGVFTVGKRLTEPENGLIYGAACGLGFAAGENVLYFTNAWLTGVEIFIVTAIARTLTSTLLHMSATATTGFGISRSRCFATWLGTPRSWVPFYLLAVIMHSSFNLLALLGQGDPVLALFTLALSFMLVVIAVTLIRRKIVELDRDYRPGVIRCQ